MISSEPIRPLRVLSYNVHGCVGTDGRRSESRIAETIAGWQPDVVGLQELDLGRQRSSGVDQAKTIAEHLGFQHSFHPAMKKKDEHYGDAILSRWPITVLDAGELPTEKAVFFKETRGALRVKIAAPEGSWQVINTHFGLGRTERNEQAAALIGPRWLGAVPEDEPLLVLGDFNSFPRSAACRLLRNRLHDAALASGAHRHRATFPAKFPVFTLDYIFINDAVAVESFAVCRSSTGSRASDHLPILAVVRRKEIQAEIPADA